jgi:uncharacterized protein (DUF2345 family)
MNLKSGSDMTITSDAKLTVTASNAIELICKGSSIKMDGEIDLKAKMINEN